MQQESELKDFLASQEDVHNIRILLALRLLLFKAQFISRCCVKLEVRRDNLL
jgi:hypothetical protein